MNVLKSLIIIVLIAAKSEQQTSGTGPLAAAPATCVVPKPICYRNRNGFCRTFDTACDASNGNCGMKNPAMHWNVTTSTNCELRKSNQVKVCYDDCPIYSNSPCNNGIKVCATSFEMQECRVFDSLCSLKKVSCKDLKLKDWRVASNPSACNGLEINGKAIKCTVLN